MDVMDSRGVHEVRRLTPEEIGNLAKYAREQLGLKQLTLSVRANVSMRTIQRIESGQKADDLTLEDVAEALGMERSAFTKVYQLPDFEQLAEEVREISANTKPVDAVPVKSWRDFEAICRVHGHMVDDRQIDDPDLAERTLFLRDYIGDCVDIHDVATASEMLPYYKTMLGVVEEVTAKGYHALYTVYRTDEAFTVAIVAFIKESTLSEGPPSQFLVPRSFMSMVSGTANRGV